MRRSVERGGDGRQHRQRIHDLRRSAHAHDDRNCTGDDTTQHGDQDQHPLPAAPVGQRRQQRGQDRGRGHPKESHQPDGCRATVPVGHDPEPDGERPLRRPGSEEAELGAPKVGVSGVAGERARGIAQPAPEPLTRHHATVPSGAGHRAGPGSWRQSARRGLAPMQERPEVLPSHHGCPDGDPSPRCSLHGSATASSWSACASRDHRGGCSSTAGLPTPGRCSRPGWPTIRASTSP